MARCCSTIMTMEDIRLEGKADGSACSPPP